MAKIANAMDVPLASFFSDHESDGNGNRSLPQLSDDQVRFLNQVRRYSSGLNESDRKLVLQMVKKMAASTGK